MEFMETNDSTVTNITYYDNIDNDLLLPKYGYIFAATVLSLIGFFGFTLNLMVIVLMIKEKLVSSPLNIILFNLVCSDFSVSIFGNPFTFASAVAHKWIWGKTMCHMYGFFMSLLGITSITTLTVLAFERYMIVCHAFSKYTLSNKRSVYTVLGIWIYSAILTVPPLFGWGKYVTESANISCSVNWAEQTFNAQTYIIYLFIFGLKVPLVVIIYSYIHIISTIKKNHMQAGQVTKAENRVAYMVLVMVVAFLFAWTPYAVVSLIAQFWDASLISPVISVVPALIAKSSICYNPIIYVGMNTQLRKSFLEMLHVSQHSQSNEMYSETFTVGVTTRLQVPLVLKSSDDSKGKLINVENEGRISLIQKHIQRDQEKYKLNEITNLNGGDKNDNQKERLDENKCQITTV
ncbi:unnamed protein product [Brassicogethes aeneus]|uniref:G-protein coupled receptors family 1 profile domain-containing protein n=1 Tax=Brassicogethes aeneus TaxID=1431903 RepID=A0A9P0BDB1_BRAAE|nr:unnamed protein product [Brassicogethes aeneus]